MMSEEQKVVLPADQTTVSYAGVFRCCLQQLGNAVYDENDNPKLVFVGEEIQTQCCQRVATLSALLQWEWDRPWEDGSN